MQSVRRHNGINTCVNYGAVGAATTTAPSRKKENGQMKAEAKSGKLIKDFKTLAHDAEALLKATAEDASDHAREARARLTSALETARDSIEQVEEKVVAGAKVTDKTIREHPYESIGIALGVGLLIGVFVSRK
jgi:ElaB/YqjD/DUF883 family membrane-anchored ribosome-binding protein